MYLIYPDADLCFSEAAMVIACIFLFVASLCYLGSNQLQFTPNYAMFLNYLFGIDDSHGFARLIKSIVGDHVQSEDERIQTDAKKKAKPKPLPNSTEREDGVFVYDGAKRRQMPESAQRKAERQFDADFAKQKEGQALVQIQEELRKQLTRPSAEIDWNYVRKNYRYLLPGDKKTADELYATRTAEESPNAEPKQEEAPVEIFNEMRRQLATPGAKIDWDFIRGNYKYMSPAERKKTEAKYSAEMEKKKQPPPQKEGFASNIVNRLISKSMVSGNKVSLRL